MTQDRKCGRRLPREWTGGDPLPSIRQPRSSVTLAINSINIYI